MYSSMPATFGHTASAPKRARHNITRKKRSRADKFFEGLKMTAGELEARKREGMRGAAAISAFGDSDSESDDEGAAARRESRLSFPPAPQSTMGRSGEPERVREPFEGASARAGSDAADAEEDAEQRVVRATPRAKYPENVAAHEAETTLPNASRYDRSTYSVDTAKWFSVPDSSQYRDSRAQRMAGPQQVGRRPQRGGGPAPVGAGAIDPTSPLLKRLNYAIQLLEEKRDMKTETVTEELILYGLLGVFIIYAVHSFVRVGEYKH
jgi:hypothetical protein